MTIATVYNKTGFLLELILWQIVCVCVCVGGGFWFSNVSCYVYSWRLKSSAVLLGGISRYMILAFPGHNSSK